MIEERGGKKEKANSKMKSTFSLECVSLRFFWFG